MRFSYLLSALIFSSLTLVLSTPVLDVDQQKLQEGKNYYILPADRGFGGGLALASRNRTCPYSVVQENMDVLKGLPVKFFPADKGEKEIQVSMDMNVVFSAATICVQSTTWRLGDIDRRTGKRYVTTGGVTGSPGVKTVSNWFKIERYLDNYKLVFCPSVCSFCKVVCGDLGVFVEDGKRWLGLSDVPLQVRFMKV